MYEGTTTGGNLGINPIYPQLVPHVCPNCGACPNCGRFLIPPQLWPVYPSPYVPPYIVDGIPTWRTICY